MAIPSGIAVTAAAADRDDQPQQADPGVALELAVERRLAERVEDQKRRGQQQAVRRRSSDSPYQARAKTAIVRR